MINIYTDGGSRGNGESDSLSAWAYTIQYGDNYKEDSKAEVGKTNNQMELQACIEALKSLKRFDLEISLHSDSTYVIKGITEWVTSWKRNGWTNSKKKPVLNRELWEELDNLNMKFDSLKWIKVKGHSDNEGNNRADLLVNNAMDEYVGNTKD